jgi:hypothetical protein
MGREGLRRAEAKAAGVLLESRPIPHPAECHPALSVISRVCPPEFSRTAIIPCGLSPSPLSVVSLCWHQLSRERPHCRDHEDP